MIKPKLMPSHIHRQRERWHEYVPYGGWGITGHNNGWFTLNIMLESGPCPISIKMFSDLKIGNLISSVIGVGPSTVGPDLDNFDYSDQK